MIKNTLIDEATSCYHCGEDCADDSVHIQDKNFCCEGCKMVYEILNQNNLCEYYDISEKPGIHQKIKVREGKFSFLEHKEIAAKLIHFSDGNQKHVRFYLPQMHCSSCIWLLEHLPKMSGGIIKSQVNFLKKEITVTFNSELISLKKLAELLTSIGYEPHISMADMDNSKTKKYDRSRIYKIGIAGFCFGNIMMLSLPEYFSVEGIQEQDLKLFFNQLNVLISLPVFFYCASEFFVSAYKSLRQKFLNIDAPIALAVLITFSRSIYEIVTQSGAGYLDSMSGIVFFMLIGRFFQDKTYQSLSFERDYKSYFPIGVTRIMPGGFEEQIPISEIKKGQRLKIHNDEIIPADGMLFMGSANIDYSFVTGESLPSEKSIGELVYAGGKQVGQAIEIEVVNEISQSYLTQLWNNSTFKKADPEQNVSFVHRVSKYFTVVLFSIAAFTALYWTIQDPSRTWSAVTAVLIVACPCALLLSSTFTNGNMLSKLQGFGFFVKNSNVLEAISKADTIVFDKTGTLSMQENSHVAFIGNRLSAREEQLIRSTVVHSNHPLSKAIAASLSKSKNLKTNSFTEEKGKGCRAIISGKEIKIGSLGYVTGNNVKALGKGSTVYVSIDDKLLGFYVIQKEYREGLQQLIVELKKQYRLALLSGDNDSEARELRKIFGDKAEFRFENNPQDKLDYILYLQKNRSKVIMIGDGLNDAGALRQSDVGIVVSDNINNFSPACDAILDGKQFNKLKKLIDYCRKEKKIIYGSFIISILYNIAGLSIAVQGQLSPVIAAILMPLSSISIVLYTTFLSTLYSKNVKS